MAKMDKATWWRAQSPESRQSVAKELGRSRMYLDHVFLYGRQPGPSLAIRIHEISGGKVTPDQLRDDLPAGVFRKRPVSA